MRTGLDWCRYNSRNRSKDNRYIKHSYKLKKKKEEGKERFTKDKIKADLVIFFLVSQIFFKKAPIIKRIYTKKIHSIGILQKIIYPIKI
jgi:hypothetical protein